MDYLPHRCLVTGATGFVGAAVARCLQDQGWALRVLHRRGAELANLRGIEAERVIGDLRDENSLAMALRGCDTLFHVAADYRLWAPRPGELYRSNVDGSLALLRAAARAGLRRIVYTSSVAVLHAGRDGSSADEDTPVALADMIGHYKRSKFLAEQAVMASATALGLDVVVVNPSTPVGPGDIKPTPTGKLIVDAARGRIPAFVDTGLNVVHVDDVAQGHLLAFRLGQTGRRYILGGENLSLAQILAVVAEHVGRPAPRLRLPHGLVWMVALAAQNWARLRRSEGEPLATLDGVRMARKRMYFSSERACRELGYRPRPAVQGLHEAVDWFAARGYLD